MRWPLKLLPLILVFALTPSVLAFAQDLDEAMAKYRLGDYQGALENWQELASIGNTDAWYNLGQMYRLGQGISFDFPKATENYTLAAVAGHTAAQRELGNLYFFSIGTDAAQARAIPWWQRAAANGDAKAQYILGILYFNGDVVTKDRVMGFAWTLLAMDGGVPEALQSNTAMRSQLSETELARALTLAPNLMTGNPNQGLYTNLIGEPFPRPRTIIAGIKVAEVEPEPEALQELPFEEVEAAVEPPEELPPPLELASSEIVAEEEAFEPLPEAEIQTSANDVMSADPPEQQEQPLVLTETVTEPEPEAAPDLPELIPEDEYDLGDPLSPLVDAEGFGGTWSIQLTSFRRPENAQAHWLEVSTKYPELFDLAQKKILRFDLGPERGIYYRLRIGPFLDQEMADAKCLEITETGLGCLVIWP